MSEGQKYTIAELEKMIDTHTLLPDGRVVPKNEVDTQGHKPKIYTIKEILRLNVLSGSSDEFVKEVREYIAREGDIEEPERFIKAMMAFLIQSLVKIERLQEESRWIPVGDRLPELRTKVLTIGTNEPLCDQPQPAVAWMGEGGKWWTYGNHSGFYAPTHWKPIILPVAQPRRAL